MDEVVSKLTAKPKNFTPVHYPKLAKFQDRLRANQQMLKEVRERCSKQSVDGRVNEELFREILLEDIDEAALEEAD